jgi:hypothetical protein
LQIREVVMSALIVRIYWSLLPRSWDPLNRCLGDYPGWRWRVKRRMVASSLIVKSWRFCWSRLNVALRRLKWHSWRWLINLAIRIIIVRKLNRWFFWQRNRPIILASCWWCRRLTRTCNNILSEKQDSRFRGGRLVLHHHACRHVRHEHHIHRGLRTFDFLSLLLELFFQ